MRLQEVTMDLFSTSTHPTPGKAKVPNLDTLTLVTVWRKESVEWSSKMWRIRITGTGNVRSLPTLDSCTEALWRLAFWVSLNWNKPIIYFHNISLVIVHNSKFHTFSILRLYQKIKHETLSNDMLFWYYKPKTIHHSTFFHLSLDMLHGMSYEHDLRRKKSAENISKKSEHISLD